MRTHPLKGLMRLPTVYKPAGTDSYRLASSMLFGYGINAQNTDKRVISMVDISHRPGWVFVQADQSGAEAMVVAYLARPGRYRDLFINKIKPHTYLASYIFKKTFNTAWVQGLVAADLAKDPRWKAVSKIIKDSAMEYDLAKRTIHGWSYKMQWKTFSENVYEETGGSVILTRKEAMDMLEGPSILFPEVIEWQRETVDRAYTYGLLHNMLGYPILCAQNKSPSYERQLISVVPQSTVGCITHIAMRECWDYVRDNNLAWYLLSNKHDSYMTLCPESEALDCAKYMNKTLCQTLTGREGVQFTMRSEVAIGKNWGKWHPDKNPNGMKEVEL
jgi:hypothetical protein